MQNDTCYILALVKRDDGQRLLLGSGYYEFNKDQKHFNPNLFANDIVELQGADGQLLAGQVRRSTAQSFDGYIGDGTTAKTIVEQKRREFFLFFRKQHHYTVVYIMPDGTAIKRDRGYIVDAPAVQELYQVQPKWHVSLAFEDVNYYSYAEDDHGNETYSFEADLSLASVQGGGLIWDADGAISTAAGLGNIRINGDTFQNGTPSPNNPVAVQTVTGQQTIAINGTNYTVDLGATELCKLGTYQDYIWKDGDDWKVHKEIGTVVANASNDKTWTKSGQSTSTVFVSAWTNMRTGGFVHTLDDRLYAQCFSYSGSTAVNTARFNKNVGSTEYDYLLLRFDISVFDTLDKVKTWLNNNPQTVYYQLATPTDTTITDAALIAQLEAVAEAMGEHGKPSSITPTGTNLPAIITGDLNGTGGYEWEAAAGGGPSYITVNGVDDAMPVWYVTGPCANPTLTNSSTGISITWNGTVPSGQTLIVDMGAQTATMEGANVFQFISGSWLALSPGTNRIAYTAANTTTGCKLYWNEIVG